jgi:cysteinyl-tRNA synthetase
MYVCGMTVYSDAHIGHARTYFAFDVIRRYFEYKGYQVTYVQNITDVDDKIIAAANNQDVDPLEYSQRYTKRCLGDLDRLGIRRADLYIKASESIPDMIEMIQSILERGFGYVADGDVYFSVEKFPDYGKLSGQKVEEMKTGARIQPGEKKQSPLDFALWKQAKPGEPSWKSPWGRGRPGWHIECSAMSSKYLDVPFDIHGGGMDLRFPHHENEIAQAENATGKQFVKYWMHVGLLTVQGEKMSKSLGNIVNIRDLLRDWDPEVVRFFFAQTHYRNPPDFNEKALTDAQKSLDRIYRVKEKLEDLSEGSAEDDYDPSNEKRYLSIVNDFKNQFEHAMDDDFNAPQAIAAIFDFVNKTNKFFEEYSSPSPSICRYARETFVKLGTILTLFQPPLVQTGEEEAGSVEKLGKLLSQYVEAVAETDLQKLMGMILRVREEARWRKDWATADSIRKELEALGFEIQDTAEGPVWRKK